ncbi:DUF4982 domain-containing protein [bacterium]|nr:DUF4982 domain-containing protein [bacterium]
MRLIFKKIVPMMLLFFVGSFIIAKAKNENRECILMDSGWKFAFGHPYDTDKDFKHATGYFSYFAKAGYGDGPASANFDDRAWRILDLPHDWAVEQSFESRGSHSHGYKAIGRNFPETSIGWYRKSFWIPESDLGRRISVQFDGVFRNSLVWVNGFYLGHEPSGYSGFWYDITDYLNYGGENIIAVRVDVIMEEGWFYEGAGIYRHVWLIKMSPLHIVHDGLFVFSDVYKDKADVTLCAKVVNEDTSEAVFDIQTLIIDEHGHTVASKKLENLILTSGKEQEYTGILPVKEPELWSCESPFLYQMVTKVIKDHSLVDRVETCFGIRSVRFDPDQGLFLNGKSVKLKGTNNHQDHAGVGTALPDELQVFRIDRLKAMGCNAYRCSHNPPAPELLDACDRLGMLVIDENRLMGSSPEPLDQLRRLIERDRNHPSVIIWSLGNEEWAIEGNVKGARIASTMQDIARGLDPTRRVTAASSGGWGLGISTVIDVMGYNYIRHGNTDEHHARFPGQPGIGTEESTTQGTRGVYVDDNENAHMAPTDRRPNGSSIETGWKYYAERDYLAGLFYWTGFDYRGESNPFGFPAVSSQFGILDLCGFHKDPFYYLKAWWTSEPVLHISPHWNWKGREGEEIHVWIYSNCEEVELLLNGSSLGRQTMEKYSHLEWKVLYEPGVLEARGFTGGKTVLTYCVETTDGAHTIALKPHRSTIKADGRDISIIAVRIQDSKGRLEPDANQEITFHLKGPGKIIGTGNGDPSCHEPDQYVQTVIQVNIDSLKALAVDGMDNRPEVAYDYDDSEWLSAFSDAWENPDKKQTPIKARVIRGKFDLPELPDNAKVTLFSKSLCQMQSIYINGRFIAGDIQREAPDQAYKLDHIILKSGKNSFAVVGPPLIKRHRWENLNTDPGIIQVIVPPAGWKRSAFHGLAQIIVQSEQTPGNLVLTASSQGLISGVLNIKSVLKTEE